MSNKYVRHTCAVVIIVVGILAATALLGGCGGSDSTQYGGARGYVYQPIGGGVAIVSASSTPPTGYQPVPAGTVVRIDGLPELRTTTDANGFYRILLIPAGTQTLVIHAPSGTINLTIPIIGGRITSGGGHSEGGG